MAVYGKLDQDFPIFALCIEIDLFAVGIFATREVELVGTLDDFVDIQFIRAGGKYLEADDSVFRTKKELSAFTKGWCVRRA